MIAACGSFRSWWRARPCLALPESLAGLARRNALVIRHQSFRSDAGHLVAAIERVLAAPGAAAVSTGSGAHGVRPAEEAAGLVALTQPAIDPKKFFKPFTDRARNVLVLAEEEARSLNHHHIGTEHILLGLLHEGQGTGWAVLEMHGIGLDRVRQQVEEITRRGQQTPAGSIRFTARSNRVLILSVHEAQQLGVNYVATEHILLGLIREGKGLAVQLLVKLGANPDAIRQQVFELLADY